MNAVAFFHAWRFTHFANEPGLHSPNPEQLSPGQKGWLLLTGIRNPKPRNGPKPGLPGRNRDHQWPQRRTRSLVCPAR